MRYTVAVFPLDGGKFIAYLSEHRGYSSDRPDCCIHEVEAMTGVKAKRVAVDEHMEACIKAEEPGGKHDFNRIPE